MLSIRQLKYLIKIVELGSMNEASKQLFIAQPTLSNTIKSLESYYGISIFKRSTKGVILTDEGVEFLTYARQIVDQVDLLNAKYHNKNQPRRLLSISCQHYAFAVQAFSDLIKHYDQDEYDFSLRETQTNSIFEDLTSFRSEVGILYINDFNKQVLQKKFKDNNLEFVPLFIAKPHIFISKYHPLAQKHSVNLEDLETYPYLSFDQGKNNSFYFSEEILSTVSHKKSIMVSDRATIFNLMMGVNGYTISTGVISKKLNDENIISVPLNIEDEMTIGYLKHKQALLSPLAQEYLKYLKHYISEYGFEILEKNDKK